LGHSKLFLPHSGLLCCYFSQLPWLWGWWFLDYCEAGEKRWELVRLKCHELTILIEISQFPSNKYSSNHCTHLANFQSSAKVDFWQFLPMLLWRIGFSKCFPSPFVFTELFEGPHRGPSAWLFLEEQYTTVSWFFLLFSGVL
jgi:hypothetical protein